MLKNYLTLLLIACSVDTLATDIYRIVDENGRVQYSQIPPYKDAKKIQIKGAQSSTQQTKQNNQASLQERQERYSNYLESERLERKQQREDKKQKKAELASNCHTARADLEDMNQGGIMYYDLDENGERVYIDESRVEEKKARLKKYLQDNCRSIVNISKE